MKLGEALSLRAQQAQKLNDLRGRILANVQTQEGETPREDPNVLLQEYEVLSGQHRDLVRRINATNEKHGLAVTLHEREHLRRVRNMLTAAADAAAPSSPRDFFRYQRSELRTIPHVDVPKLRGDAEEATEEIRGIDAQIQERNWQADLVEIDLVDFDDAD